MLPRPESDPGAARSEAGPASGHEEAATGQADALPDPEVARVRRRDRAKDDVWIEAFLAAAPWGVFAVQDGGRPFLNSNLFVYGPERRALYFHTARVGRTRSVLDGPEPATFTAASMGRLLPAHEALEFSVEYAAVVVFGTARLVGDPEEEVKALQALLDKYAPHLRPGRDYRGITGQEVKRTSVYRLDVEAWSGKEKFVEPDFPGAFELSELTVPFSSGD